MAYGPHIDWRGVTSVQGGILADYDQFDTHVPKWIPDKFGYPKFPHLRAAHDWIITSKLCFDAIYLSLDILVSRQSGILADYHQIDTHVLKLNPEKCGYPRSHHIGAARVSGITWYYSY